MAISTDELFDFDTAHQQIRVRSAFEINHPQKGSVFLAPHTMFHPGGPRAGNDGWLDYAWLIRLAGTRNITGVEARGVLEGRDDPFAKLRGTAFDRYYDQFLQNSLRGRRYQITLTSGELATGVPTSGSLVDPRDPNVSFSFRVDSGNAFRIPFAALREAAPIDNVSGIIRTVGPHIVAANDVMIEVPRVTANGLLVAEYAVFTVAITSGNYLPTHGHIYKFVTVQGSEFTIASIEQRQSDILQLTVGPAPEASPYGEAP